MHPDILAEKEQAKMMSADRIFSFEPIDGKAPISAYGTVDNRLFKGGNRLHAKRDPQSYMWVLQYENGTLPEVLKQKFTKWDILLKTVNDYYNKRNLQIAKIES